MIRAVFLFYLIVLTPAFGDDVKLLRCTGGTYYENEIDTRGAIKANTYLLNFSFNLNVLTLEELVNKLENEHIYVKKEEYGPAANDHFARYVFFDSIKNLPTLGRFVLPNSQKLYENIKINGDKLETDEIDISFITDPLNSPISFIANKDDKNWSFILNYVTSAPKNRTEEVNTVTRKFEPGVSTMTSVYRVTSYVGMCSSSE